MEFQIEGILETVLVGAIASLCLLLFFFLFWGHAFRVEPIRRAARFFLYEQKSAEEPKVTVEPGEKQISFAWLILLALLYGLGATVESITHDLTNDQDIKNRAFLKVGRGQVEGGTAPARFSQFVTDDIACRDIGLNEKTAPRAIPVNKDTKGEGANPVNAPGSPCYELFNREREFYYEAKSSVFQKETFAHELGAMQGRINFVRSAGYALGALSAVTLVVALFAFIFEKRVKDWDTKPLRRHLKDLAAVRCLVISLLLAALTLVCFGAWCRVETQYDQRIFGYLLSLVDSSAEDRDTHLPAKSGEEATSHASEHPIFPHHVVTRPLPTSPYRVFSIPTGTQLEPSAIQPLGSAHFIVANDRGGADPFLVFDLEDGASLGNPRVLRNHATPGANVKFEALNAYVSSDGQHVLALESSTVDKDTPLTVYDMLLSGTDEVVKTEKRSVANPCRVVAEKFAVPESTSCSIEGLTLRGGRALADGPIEHDGYLQLGIRYLHRPGKHHLPVMAVVSLKKAPGNGWRDPTVVFHRLPEADPCADFSSGISDIQVLDEQELLVLSSIELQSDERCLGDSAHPVPIAQVRGALWTVKQSGTKEASEIHLSHRLAHKPEGMTLLKDGRVLIVFDDDGKRKSLSSAPDTFPLEQNEAVYTIVDVNH
jgi:hypothetical protein